jgi:hypothetical protein
VAHFQVRPVRFLGRLAITRKAFENIQLRELNMGNKIPAVRHYRFGWGDDFYGQWRRFVKLLALIEESK